MRKLITSGLAALLYFTPIYTHSQDRVRSVEEITQEDIDFIKKDENSGILFVGFSDEEMEMARDVIARYDAINPRLIDRLEPVVIKVQDYVIEDGEVLRLRSLNERENLTSEEQLEKAELSQKMNSRVASAEHNIPDLQRALDNLGKREYQIKPIYFLKNVQKVYGEVVRTNVFDKEAALSVVREVGFKRPDGFDIVYWAGKMENERPNYEEEILSHELGHLVHYDNREEFLEMIKKFKALSYGNNLISDYSRRHFEEKQGLLEGHNDNVKMFFEEGLGMIEDYLSPALKAERIWAKIEEDEEKRKAHLQNCQTLEKSLDDFKSFIELPEVIEVRKNYDNLVRARDEEILYQEDIAEAFRFFTFGIIPAAKAQREKLEILGEYLVNYEIPKP